MDAQLLSRLPDLFSPPTKWFLIRGETCHTFELPSHKSFHQLANSFLATFPGTRSHCYEIWACALSSSWSPSVLCGSWGSRGSVFVTGCSIGAQRMLLPRMWHPDETGGASHSLKSESQWPFLSKMHPQWPLLNWTHSLSLGGQKENDPYLIMGTKTAFHSYF